MASVRLPSIDGLRITKSDEEKIKAFHELRVEMDRRHIPGTPAEEEERSRVLSNLFDEYLKGPKDYSYSRNSVHYVSAMENGNYRLQRPTFCKTFGLEHLIRNSLLKEREFNLDRVNKIFCSQWLNHHQVVVGTKCNKMIVIDVNNGSRVQIPNLKSSGKFKLNGENCGIHSIKINPSKTLLVTGAEEPHEVAVYKLPSFDAVCVGENCHEDWIFDLEWLDDQFFVSGSRDKKLSLWRVPQESDKLQYIQPLADFTSKKTGRKVRSLVFNSENTEVVTLSLAGQSSERSQLRFYDPIITAQKTQIDLPESPEYVCMAQNPGHRLYGVGSKALITLVDSRDGRNVKKIPTTSATCIHHNIRSINFSENVCSVGTGSGRILFYDLRKNDFFRSINPMEDFTFLTCSPGFTNHDVHYYEAFVSGMEYSPAVYTHCFDSSSLRLFSAGGPLPANISGNYASLWS